MNATSPKAARKAQAANVKQPLDVLESGRIVAALAGETLTDLFAGILRPQLAKMERELIARRTRDVAADRPTKGGA